jgi:hypothetical protein
LDGADDGDILNQLYSSILIVGFIDVSLLMVTLLKVPLLNCSLVDWIHKEVADAFWMLKIIGTITPMTSVKITKPQINFLYKAPETNNTISITHWVN